MRIHICVIMSVCATSLVVAEEQWKVSTRHSLKSNYWVIGGLKLSDDPVYQSNFAWSKAGLTGYIWQNTEIGSEGMTELDIGCIYNFDSMTTDEIGSFGASFEAAVWTYPVSKKLGDTPDWVLIPTFWWDVEVVRIEYELRQLLTSGSGRQHQVRLSQTFPIHPKIDVTPFAAVSYHDNFFGLEGEGAASVGFTAMYEISPSVQFGGTLTHQSALNQKFEDGWYGGVSLGISF